MSVLPICLQVLKHFGFPVKLRKLSKAVSGLFINVTGLLQRVMEDQELQAVQPGCVGGGSPVRPPPPSAQGQGRVQADLPGNGVSANVLA